MHSQDCSDGCQAVVSKEDVICMMPWVHLHVWPNGSVFPCCVSNSDVPVGRWPDSSLDEIWNSEGMRSLRKNMLDGKRSERCTKCYTIEHSGLPSLRNHSNEAFAHLKKNQEQTEPDGSVDKIMMAYLDVRFSNICNLKCRTCGPELSSAWYDDHSALFPNRPVPRVVNINKTGQFWKELEQYLYQTEEVMFAGGESIITDEHYRILDYFLDNKMTNVRLRYTTNFTNFNYKNRNLFEMWSKFDDVRVRASLDGSYKRGEYLRKGMVWSKVVENRKQMLKEAPNTHFDITATVSLMNVLHLPDFHKEWTEQQLCDINNFTLNILIESKDTSIRVLPRKLKDRVKRVISDHTEWMRKNGAYRGIIEQWNGLITFMEESDDSRLLILFHDYMDRLDKLRSESFYDVFPELEELYD